MPDGLLDKIGAVKQRELTKEELALAKPRRIRDRDHLKFVAAQPCLICDRRPSQAHHIRYARPRAMGRKVSDEFTVPLCAGHHREMHGFGDERKWWKTRDIDPLPIARNLWVKSNGQADAQD